MKKIVIISTAVIFLLGAGIINADARGYRSSYKSSYRASKSYGFKKISVRGYIKKNGAYVRPHNRSTPSK